MKYIETLKASTYNQAQAFFFSEMQKALGTKAEQLLQWLSFEPELLDLTTDETVYMYRLELPTFELLSFGQQLEFANNAAADIIQQYTGIWVNIAYDEEMGVIVVYLASEDVTLDAIEKLFHLDDEEEPQRAAHATVAPLTLVPTVHVAPAPVEQPNAASEPVAPATGGPQGFHANGAAELDDEPETFATEDEPSDVPEDEPFNEEMLTIEQTAAIDAMRKDEDAAAFIRANLETGVEQFDAFVEFNDVSDFPMSVVYRALELYEEFQNPQPKTEVEQIFSEEEPDAFPVEEAPDDFPLEETVTTEAAPAAEVVAESEPARTAPIGGERAPDAAIAEAEVSEADSHAIRFAQILQDIAKQLPDDSLSEIADGALTIIMTRSTPNESGVGSQDIDYNLRLTIRREMFAGVREIDKYRLENNGDVIVETGSAQVVIDTINGL